MDTVEKVAEAVLYEGYLLYPYTQSALKNQLRWTFGGVYPHKHSEATAGIDPWTMQTQCLVTGGEDTQIEVKVRFLQVVDRRILVNAHGGERAVEELNLDSRLYRPAEEAVEREVVVCCRLGDLVTGAKREEISVPFGRSDESLTDSDGRAVGKIAREWQELHGAIQVGARSLGPLGFRLTVRIDNDLPFTDSDRAMVIRRSFISTHTILRCLGGEFISLLEPPSEYEQAAKECENVRTWPVLVGEPHERGTLLSSPIILYDYPQISPESPGDLFDGTEIDELLRFSILTLTDEEKREMREANVRSRQILERTESLTPDELLRLHPSMRRVQEIRGMQL